MEYGRKLAEFRLDRGMTQEELASTIGVSPEDILSWESCSDYPSKFHLAAVATALRVKISSIIDKDIDAMMAAIHVAETRETLCMATLTALALVCTAGLVATSRLSPDSVPAAANVVKALLLAIFLVLVASRRSKTSLRAKAYREALEAADGSHSAFVLKRKAREKPQAGCFAIRPWRRPCLLAYHASRDYRARVSFTLGHAIKKGEVADAAPPLYVSHYDKSKTKTYCARRSSRATAEALPLFHRHALGKVARLVHVASA